MLVKIDDSLSVSTDALLFNAHQVNRTVMTNEISDILSSCKPHELKIITDVIKSLKILLDENND